MGLPVAAVQMPGEIANLEQHFEGVEWIETELGADTPGRPRAPRIHELARHCQDGPIILINSDISTKDKPSEFRRAWCRDLGRTLVVGVRKDYSKVGGKKVLNPYGIDAFKLIPEIFEHLVDRGWTIGYPGWDYDLCLRMYYAGFEVAVAKSSLLHPIHGMGYTDADIKAATQKLSADFRIPEKVVSRFIQGLTGRLNLRSRKPIRRRAVLVREPEPIPEERLAPIEQVIQTSISCSKQPLEKGLLADVAIFIKSWKNDLQWLRHCLRSIQVFFPQCQEIHLVLDENCRSRIRNWGLTKETVHFVPDHPVGYLQQQAVKLQAHTYTNKPYILFLDSDCIFTREICDSLLFDDGKPIFLKTSYQTLGTQVPWQKPTEEAVGYPVEFEYMRRMPILADRESLILVAQRYPDLAESLLKSKRKRTFSEFNVIGAVAEKFHPERYSWIDTDKESIPQPFAKQFWSWGGLTTELNTQIQMQIDVGSKRREPPGLRLTSLAENTEVKTLASGISVIANDSHISKWVEEAGTLAIAARYLSPFQMLVPENGIVIDIGACIGDHTETYASWVPRGKVLAFEPNPTAFECLCHNMRRYQNVSPFRLALGDFIGTTEIVIEDNAGASYLNFSSGTTVSVIQLDAFGLERVDFIKIDAEGSETRILRGAMKTIAQNMPYMLIEVNAGALVRAESSTEELLELVRQLGYELDIVGPKKDFSAPQFDIFCWPVAETSTTNETAIGLAVASS